MFARLFAEGGLSLDRLKALLEVGAAGSIAKAVGSDPVRQSQYSRQVKELEAFFRVKLLERHGKGMRLTQGGKELARISRFFLLGLSNFQRGCLMQEQTFHVGASATFIQRYLLLVLADRGVIRTGARYVAEVAGDSEIERRLHDLTLDFGVVRSVTISRPLQSEELGAWRLKLWVPRGLQRSPRDAARAFHEGRLPLALATGEFDMSGLVGLRRYEPHLACDSFLDALTALQRRALAALLPDFLSPGLTAGGFIQVPIPALEAHLFHYRLAWNPRLLRLNPKAGRKRDFLSESLARRMSRSTAQLRNG